MRYVCDVSERMTWFRIETDGEALLEAMATQIAVAYFFEEERRKALSSYRPRAELSFLERDIGLESHIQRTMPLFLTLRDNNGSALATTMLPLDGKDDGVFPVLVWGAGSVDAYELHTVALRALEKHFDIPIFDRAENC